MDDPEADMFHNLSTFVDRLQVFAHEIGEGFHLGLLLLKLQLSNGSRRVRFVDDWASRSCSDPFSSLWSFEGPVDAGIGNLDALANLVRCCGAVEDQFEVGFDFVLGQTVIFQYAM